MEGYGLPLHPDLSGEGVMDLDAIITASLAKGFAKLTDAVFIPDEGDPVPCHIDISKLVGVEPSGMETGVLHHSVTIEALISEILREPLKGETFTAGVVTYTVVAVLENDGFTILMAVI